jgi:uncharacterized membrane protein
MFLRPIMRQVWFRAAAFTVAAIVFALIAGVASPWLPFSPTLDLGQGSVDSLLQIVASSMLAVTTFSLATMVTVYSSASRIATPRATQLLVEDTTSQNVLSTFVGAFAFSLVGIVALSTGYYTEQGRTLLFLGTLVVILVIVITLLRWIAYLADFGRMADIIDRVEKAARETLTAYAKRPAMGARQQRESLPAGIPVFSTEPGYVTHIDIAALERVGDAAEVDVHVAATPGRMTDARTPLVHVSGEVDDDARDSIRRAFRVKAHRSFDQDPRLAVIALSEIGSRALSPSTNDPGTAIEVLVALERVFTALLDQPAADEVVYPHVWIRPVSLTDLVQDGFTGMARDGAQFLEVAVRQQKVLAALAAASPPHSDTFDAAAEQAARRAEAALSRPDSRALRALRRRLRPATART